MNAAMFYKVLAAGGRPHHGGIGTWHLPKGSRPGKWMPSITPVVPCESGYHLVTVDHLVKWLGPEIWVAEGRGDHVDAGDKHVFGQARLIRRLERWNERTARLFAADCAEAVLPIFEKARPGDERPRQLIEVARRFVDSQATRAELDAAGAAACAAAEVAAWDVAWVAAGVAAAWDAAWAAAGVAAAWDVAWVAAGVAARAAARAAAGAAAGVAAMDAAGDAERQWQTERLAHYMEVTP